MDFHNFITIREANKRSGVIEKPDDFYRMAMADAVEMNSAQFVAQLVNERDWERLRRPYYNVWPSIVPMLTRLNLAPQGKDGIREPIVASDIGCYTLGVYPPLQALDTCGCMGASIGQALGLEKAGVPERTVAVIGDSTFLHSGITGLIDVIYNQGKTLVVILDNETTAMTGHQGHPGTGVSVRGKKGRRVNLEALVRGIGVSEVQVVSSFDLKEIEAALKAGLQKTEASVVIVRGDCPLHVRPQTAPFRVDREKCSGCQACLELGCPALHPDGDVVDINQGLCVGAACNLCRQVCPQEAIGEAQA